MSTLWLGCKMSVMHTISECIYTQTQTHNHFTALLEYVGDHPGE